MKLDKIRLLFKIFSCWSSQFLGQYGFSVFCMNNKEKIGNEERSSANLATHILFKDLAKAYDSLPWLMFWKTLQITNINQTLISVSFHWAMENIYCLSISIIKIENKIVKCILCHWGKSIGMHYIHNFIWNLCFNAMAAKMFWDVPTFEWYKHLHLAGNQEDIE